MRRSNKIESQSPSLWWADIVGFEGRYQTSLDGDVKSLDRWVGGKGGSMKLVKGKILKPKKDRDGYLFVDLCKEGKHKRCFVHRLVAEAFILNDDPEHKTQVNHKDENPSNNNVANLEWVTPSENTNYGTRNERISKALTNGKKSKPVQAINPDNGEVVHVFPSMNEAGRNGFNHSHISACCHGKLKTYKGLIWRYAGDPYIPEHNLVVALDKKGRVVRVFSSVMEAGKHGFNEYAVKCCCEGRRKTHRKLVWQYKEDFLKRVC